MNKTLIYFFQLLKFRLSISVVFSAITGYFLGINQIDFLQLFYLIFGGFLVVGSANSFNQIIERERDKFMKRTSSRPLPSKKLSVFSATIFAIIIGFLGVSMLYFINPNCAYYGFGSIILYVFLYTPLKRFSPISLFVGAIPGAIPFLLGWVAATGKFELAAGILFAIQFFWQFPHFIAISWIQHEDYKKAGFKMMIGNEKGKISVIVSIITSICLMTVSVLPYFVHIPGLSLSNFGFITVSCLNILFLIRSIQLLSNQDDFSAKRLMMSSFIYLPLLQITLIIDKYFLIT